MVAADAAAVDILDWNGLIIVSAEACFPVEMGTCDTSNHAVSLVPLGSLETRVSSGVVC